MTESCLVLRLAGPMQSWGESSEFNRRETAMLPTKSGIVGLLAAAQGRRRSDSIEDLIGLTLGVRVDQPGTLQPDYHTVSDYRGRPLLAAGVTPKGVQRGTSPKKFTHLTTRYYLHDAVFVGVVGGSSEVIEHLADAVMSPTFPLALGRRSCVPTQPLLVRTGAGATTWDGDVPTVIGAVPWLASPHWQSRLKGEVKVMTSIDDVDGDHIRPDLPSTFDPRRRHLTSRPVRQDYVTVRAAEASRNGPESSHDPFALLGW